MPQLATQLGYCDNVQDGANSSQTFPNTNYGIDDSPLFQTISDELIITVPDTYLLTAQANLVPVTSSDLASYGIAICTTSSTSNATTLNNFCKEVFPNYNDTDNNPTLWGSSRTKFIMFCFKYFYYSTTKFIQILLLDYNQLVIL
jgi:hypothetical protein